MEINEADREGRDEFRFEAVLHKILRRDVLKQFVVHHLDRLRPKTDLSLTHAPCDLLFQFFKRAADDEKNVAVVFCPRPWFSLSLSLPKRPPLAFGTHS